VRGSPSIGLGRRSGVVLCAKLMDSAVVQSPTTPIPPRSTRGATSVGGPRLRAMIETDGFGSSSHRASTWAVWAWFHTVRLALEEAN
jgi:hypothetical protein